MFAAVNIRKPVGMTSHDVVACLRRLYKLKRIGHLGTLDPLAEGVLPVCLGQATRLIEYFPSDKRYTAEVTLGRTTTTLDREGETVTEADCSGVDISAERLEAILAPFRGTILQQVPLYSAVHVGGKKLYELARQGKTADLPVREATIHALNLLGVDLSNLAHPVLTLDVHCGSGTYIRSLARDIGDALGCGAYLSALLRTQHGTFSVQDSVSLDVLQAADDPSAFLRDPIPHLALPVLTLADAEHARLLTNGIKLDPLSGALSPEAGSEMGTVAVKLKPNAFYIAAFEGRPVGVVQAVSQKLKPIKIFYWG
jgi:tRNA pseudouridine55 synthase